MCQEINEYRGSRVLVCDDDPTYLMLMQETLQSEGFVVRTAEDGQAAWEAFEQETPDILLSDVQMPRMNGFALCERVRQHNKGAELPILMVTGADDYGSIKEAYRAGATDFLPKPIKWPMVAHRVRYMLRSRDTLTDLKSSEANLRYLAYYDPLTGLPNRQSFHDHMQRFLQLAGRGGYHAAVLFIDLDRFKRINDTLGHSYGDQVLKVVGEKLEQNLRMSDVLARHQDNGNSTEVARLGGDEFTISLNHVQHREDAALVAQRIIESLSQPIQIDRFEVQVTPSIGIAVYPDDGESVDELLKHADVAMYHAKDSGRQCFRFYCQSLNRSAMDKLTLEEDMRAAMDKGEFELYYQPQIDMRTGGIGGVEALIRWHHPKRGLVSPVEFIPVAEESGLISSIGDWVLETACKQAKHWLEHDAVACRVAVNLSSHQFRDMELEQKVSDLLQATGLPPQLLELELTESVIMNDAEVTIGRLKALRALGIHLAVDDFGTGYSSLNYLRKFPIDILKIDRSFVQHIEDDEDDLAIVKAIAALARSMRLEVVAEGVETQRQLELLSAMDCRYIQGFLYAKPLPAADCTAFFKQWPGLAPHVGAD